MTRQSCFYHENAKGDHTAVYRVKYTIGFKPDLLDQDRDLCDWCYNFLVKPLDIILELGSLDTIRKRHPRLIYIEPRRSLHSMIVVWRCPSRLDMDAEKARLKNEHKSSDNKD